MTCAFDSITTFCTCNNFSNKHLSKTANDSVIPTEDACTQTIFTALQPEKQLRTTIPICLEKECLFQQASTFTLTQLTGGGYQRVRWCIPLGRQFRTVDDKCREEEACLKESKTVMIALIILKGEGLTSLKTASQWAF